MHSPKDKPFLLLGLREEKLVELPTTLHCAPTVGRCRCLRATIGRKDLNNKEHLQPPSLTQCKLLLMPHKQCNALPT